VKRWFVSLGERFFLRNIDDILDLPLVDEEHAG
jgi:hypothetical protein